MKFNNTLFFEDSDYEYNLPDLPDEYLDIAFVENDEKIEEIEQSYPFAINSVAAETILDARKLTNGDNVKEVYSLELSNSFTSFKPGDTIGIVTKNRNEDLNKLFNHLGILPIATKKIKVFQKSELLKKNQILPPFLDKITTLNFAFKFCLDICCIPKKVLIRVLAKYTKDDKERNYLEKLCCKERPDLYTKIILDGRKTFLDLLLMFQTCCPPVVRLIENLPKLFPRPYSIASSPLASPNKIRIVFSVIEIANDDPKEGLCTGMLKKLINNKKDEKKCTVKYFFRKCNGFNLPDTDVPIILIGTGTGIAPYLGFLEHKKIQGKKGLTWLFYGCRHKNGDFLFQKELDEYLKCQVLNKLDVAFSRDPNQDAKYVQDNLKKHGEAITKLIFEDNAIIYVCGDAKNTSKDIQNSFVEIFQRHREITKQEAADFLRKLQKEKRYLQDIWI